MLEVVHHLRDEKRENFRVKIQAMLDHSFVPNLGITSRDLATEGDHRKSDYKKIKKAFFKNRKASIKWLKKLHHTNWNNAYIHPKYGAMRARLFIRHRLSRDFLDMCHLLH